MNKTSKIILIISCIIFVLTLVFLGVTKVIRKNSYSDTVINSDIKSTISQNTIDNLWVGTLDLAWKKLKEELNLDKIEIISDNTPQIVNDLNSSTFSSEMLNEKDYEIDVEEVLNGRRINAKLSKDLHFLEPFDNFNDLYRELTFGDGEDFIKYFGINSATREQVYKNVEVLFYDGPDEKDEFAVSLKTQEGDEIILYRTDNSKTFNEYYEDINKKSEEYEDTHEFEHGDQLLIPYTKVEGIISYEELLGKTIKGTPNYFYEVTQNVNFYLNEKGCNLSSVATLADTTMGLGGSRYLYFQDNFVIFMKEANASQPYFALRVDNDNILEKLEEEYNGPAVFDLTVIEHPDFDASKVEAGEYKFYEDENYEYYYPSQKTDFVRIGRGMIEDTAEEALKNGTITIELLDKYGIEYIKKAKK